jgi:hypothetical protein
MKTTISFLTQAETTRLFAAIPTKRDLLAVQGKPRTYP